MNHTVKVALAQIDLAVGDVAGNTAKIVDYAARARDQLQADLVVFPELSVCGYPPEDLLFHAGLRKRTEQAVAEICESVRGIAVLIGFPEYVGDDIYNSCAVFLDGELLCGYRKHLLPNYRVFDEERYFTAGKAPAVFRLKGVGIGLTICEDVWQRGPIVAARTAGAECVIAINGSPYEIDSQKRREEAVKARVAESRIPVLFLNMVGGQDELVFDGSSFVMNAEGKICFRAPAFDEGLHEVILSVGAGGIETDTTAITEHLSTEASVYKALITGTRDYVSKHSFPGVVIGLSGGIDSALVLAIACDALGPDRVRTPRNRRLLMVRATMSFR
jgi:NAD+ synthase (glutamine-hydrolysing)